MTSYVHGYSEREAERLVDQAGAVCELLHHDTRYPEGCTVLEAGCGVGAQTVTLAANSPGAQFVCIDIAEESLQKAQAAAEARGLANTAFRQADIHDLPYPDEHFDHIFVCYVLEHMTHPEQTLRSLRRVLKPGGTITVIEGDHGSCYWHPETDASVRAWRCLIEAQAHIGCDSLIGRRLYPLLRQGGFEDIAVSPRMVYCDRSRPALTDAFVRKTIIPMVEGVREYAPTAGISEAEWERGITDLHATADRDDGTFCYTFFKAVAIR